MHLDEIAGAAAGLTFAEGAGYRADADRLTWQWTRLSIGDFPAAG